MTAGSVSVVGAVAGAPGVTTTLLALVATWPAERPVLVVELGPAGGDLATWLDLPAAPSTVTLATEGRHGLSAELVWGHTHPLPGPGRVRLLAGPPGSEQALAARRRLVEAGLAGVLAGLDADVLVDAGWVGPGPLLGAPPAGRLLLAVRPTVAQVRHLRARPQVAADAAGLVLVGTSPYRPEEVADAVGLPVLGIVPEDARAAAALAQGGPTRRLARTPLLRSARLLAGTLSTQPTRADAAQPQRPAPETLRSARHGVSVPPAGLAAANGDRRHRDDDRGPRR